MIPWIQVYSNLPRHPKTSRFADDLGLTVKAVNPNAVAAGILVCLWTWAIQNAYDGDLSRCGARAIADACMWHGKPETLIGALRSSGYLDENMHLHDWEEYSILLIEAENSRREKARERVKKSREKKRAERGPMKCQYCGADAVGFDHIIPLASGGADEEDNLVPCCPWCNSSKQDRPLVTFLNRNLDRVNVDSVTNCEKLSRYVQYDADKKKFVAIM